MRVATQMFGYSMRNTVQLAAVDSIRRGYCYCSIRNMADFQLTRVDARHCHARTAGNHKSVRIQKGVTGYKAGYFQI